MLRLRCHVADECGIMCRVMHLGFAATTAAAIID